MILLLYTRRLSAVVHENFEQHCARLTCLHQPRCRRWAAATSCCFHRRLADVYASTDHQCRAPVSVRGQQSPPPPPHCTARCRCDSGRRAASGGEYESRQWSVAGSRSPSLCRHALWTSAPSTACITTRSAVAEGPRDALCQLKFSQLLQNCTRNRIWRLAISDWPWRSLKVTRNGAIR